LRGALGGTDIEKIKAAHERLSQVSQEAGSQLYSQGDGAQAAAGEAPGGAAGGPTGSGPAAGGDDVVDAEIVEDDKK
jgi:molecular chaperone DnaK